MSSYWNSKTFKKIQCISMNRDWNSNMLRMFIVYYTNTICISMASYWNWNILEFYCYSISITRKLNCNVLRSFTIFIWLDTGTLRSSILVWLVTVTITDWEVLYYTSWIVTWTETICCWLWGLSSLCSINTCCCCSCCTGMYWASWFTSTCWGDVETGCTWNNIAKLTKIFTISRPVSKY